jgi:hypothetical protein
MFKGFLGKRVPSSEFTIVASPTAADEAAGKDNMFESAPRRSSADAMPPPAFLPKSRIASGAWKVGKGKQSKGSPTEQAFDKLLVSAYARVSCIDAVAYARVGRAANPR